MRRVAITGLGCISALGLDTASFWQSLMDGKSGHGPITLLDASRVTAPVACEARGFDGAAHFPGKQIDLLDRFSQFGAVAAREAVADAGLSLKDMDPYRTGVSLGTGAGGARTEDDGYVALYGRQASRVHPLTIPRLMYNAAASHVSMDLGLHGPVLVYSSACASGTHALGEAAEMIRAGRADCMIAGGADAPICYGFIKCWEAMRVLGSVCRPFSAGREGIVIGEGAGIVVLEEWERARRRGARIYAELAGYGASADAGHITQVGLEAPAAAVRQALSQAGLAPGEVDYVNAHGTGTRLNDAVETQILKYVFGADAARLAISSTKSMHGHCMGATGAIEFVATVLAVHHAAVPPTANYAGRDPECDLDYVVEGSRAQPVRNAISNSFAFGGLNAVLAIRRVS